MCIYSKMEEIKHFKSVLRRNLKYLVPDLGTVNKFRVIYFVKT